MAATGGAVAQDLTKVTVAIPNPSIVYVFPLAVAMEEGFFAAQGLDVEVQVVDGSAQVIQMMAAGQAQIGNPGPAPTLAAVERGVDIVFMYNHSTKNGWRIGVPEGSDVTSLADLKGKTVGAGTADGSDAGFARSVLASAGLGPDDYNLIAVGDGGLAIAAVARNDIDAYVAGINDAAIMSMRGVELTNLTPPEFAGFFSNGLAVMRPWAEENRDLVVGFGKAWVQAVRFGMDDANEDKVLADIAAVSPAEGEDPEFARAFFRVFKDHISRLDDTKGWGYQDPAAWKRWEESIVASGGLKGPLPDLTRAYTNDYIDEWNAN
ncbi:ABC transporter substrate-binding protein [Devosia enhydra]|nr:ABC transporter substrate-binding protein [Devosia enhydra]